MKILAMVAARGGSKGVPGKNIRPLYGKPLIAHSLETLKKWGKADRLIVSTDSPDIAKVAKEYGAEVPFMRPTELATDTADKLPVLKHALKTVEEMNHETFDIVVDLDAAAPLRQVKDLENCLKIFLEKRPTTLFSAVNAHKNPYFNMVEEDPNGFVSLCKKLPQGVTRRQDAPKVYAMNASIYFYDAAFLRNASSASCITEKSIVYEMDEWTAFDIDREIDFKFVEFILEQKLFSIA